MRTEAVEKRLNSLPDLSRKGKRVNGLFRLLTSSPSVWEKAYEAIASNQGALTPGTDPGNTLDGFSVERMERIVSRIKDGTYRFSPARRHYIPKANGKKRPLGIPNADDKLAQSAVKIVLEKIYEPIFSRRSHGFRPGRSCHTALEHIHKGWTGTVWLVEVGIEGFFDNIDHDILLKLLRKRIDDEAFLSLIKGMLKAGYVEDWTWYETMSGTPQGGVISPLLANVYLHELDEFMAALKTGYDLGKRRADDPEYRSLRKKIGRCRRRVNELREQSRETESALLLTQIRELQRELRTLPARDQFDPEYRRLFYTRYADDFLIGIIGAKQEAREVMAKVRQFLKDQLGLNVSDEKSDISKASDGVLFLGYTVKTHDSQRLNRVTIQGRTVTMRAPSRRVQLHVPDAKMCAFVERQRFGGYHTVRGEMRPELVNSSDAEIITAYNVVMRGFAEYYKLGQGWREELARVHRIWWFSLMKTLARKHKCSLRTIYRTLLAAEDGELGVWTERGEKRCYVKMFKLAHIEDEQPSTDEGVDRVSTAHRMTLGRSDMIDRLRARTCECCGTENAPVEIHHARRLRDTSHLSLAARVAAARRRKRIVLCRPCHQALHKGELQQRLDQTKASIGAG